jgi:hypothetical protein
MDRCQVHAWSSAQIFCLMHLVSNKDNARVDEVISFGEISIMPSWKSLFGVKQNYQKLRCENLPYSTWNKILKILKMNN